MNKMLKIISTLLLLLTFTLQAQTTVTIVQGEECMLYMKTLTSLRLSTFKEFPYLYIGDESYENIYSGDFPKNPNTLFALAYIDNEFAGILTGIPLEAILRNESEVELTWSEHNMDVSNYFYYGDAIIIEKFRKCGIANLLSLSIEKEISSLGYQNVCFITVDREEDHPLRPVDYHPKETYLPKKGYIKTTMKSDCFWPTLQVNGNVEIALNTVTWWVKTLTVERKRPLGKYIELDH